MSSLYTYMAFKYLLSSSAWLWTNIWGMFHIPTMDTLKYTLAQTQTARAEVNSGVWRGFVMRIRINLSPLLLTPAVLFSEVILTLVTHFFSSPPAISPPSCSPLYANCLISSFLARTTAPSSEHILIICPGDIRWTGCTNLLCPVWILLRTLITFSPPCFLLYIVLHTRTICPTKRLIRCLW